MPLLMTTVRRISFDSAPKKYWELKPDDVVLADHGGKTVEFVKLHRSTSVGLPRLVYDGCADAARTLTTSKGYAALLDLRNETQSQLEHDEMLQKLPPMVREHAQVKRHRVSRGDRAAAGSTTMTVKVNEGHGAPFDVTMLRHKHPCDDVAVLLDMDMLEKVVTYLAHSGCSAQPEKERLPTGVRRVGKKFGYVVERGKRGVKGGRLLRPGGEAWPRQLPEAPRREEGV